jgi:multidrug efflux pump subunit AcrB
MQSLEDLKKVPVATNKGGTVLLQHVAELVPTTMPGEIDRYNMKRIVSMTANIQDGDLGDVARQVNEALAAAGTPPKGVSVDVRGQITPFNELVRGLFFGLIVAIIVIALMLTAFFQSFRLALVAVAPVPAVLAGVCVMLFVTGSTLNLQSFMGSIMAVGVATANAILLVTFAERARMAGQTAREAGIEGAASRVRPILMTSCAMIAGMVPLALGLGEGGDQVAPLGRAVIGGLAAATLTTLFVLPAIFAWVMENASSASASLSPFDPASRHFVSDAGEAAHAT